MMISARRGVPKWTFGDRLRKARRASGMTVREFAAAVGVGAASISHYETDRQRPRDMREFAARVESATGVAAAWLLGDDDELSRRFALAG